MLVLQGKGKHRGINPALYAEFRRKYYAKPGKFVEDCITFSPGDGPTEYQLMTLNDLPDKRKVTVRGPHGLGKTAMASWAILWFSLTRDVDYDWKIATTASAWRQLTFYLWPEVRKWIPRVRWSEIGRMPPSDRSKLSLTLVSGEAFALASNNPASLEGAHASALFYLFDEAKTIPEDVWDVAEGAFASPEGSEAMALAISTPGEPVGRFYDIHARKPGYEDWTAHHVTLHQAINAGRISRQWAEQRRLQWGENAAVYQNRVLGQFATSARDNIIPLSWVEAAIERWKDWRDEGFPGAFTGVGVDVGGGVEGSDLSTMALCYDHVRILEVREKAQGNPMTATMELTGQVAGILKAQGGVAFVDSIGIGAGVYHRLNEQQFDAFAFNAARGTDETDESGEIAFANWRAAGWWLLREMLEPDSGQGVCLPDDDKLIGDLTAPKVRSIYSTGRISVESKKDLRKRLGRSTDSADAVIHILIGPRLEAAMNRKRYVKSMR